MSITHEQARQLIQFKADHALSVQDLTILDLHLADCTVCASYARQIKNMESTLRQVMKRKWNAAPLPLRIESVSGNNRQNWVSTLLPTRKLMIGVTTLLFAFTIWQFMLTDTNANSILPADASPNPTPSISTVATENNFSSCDQFQYRVQPSDTLEGIAKRFSISAEVLIELNHLENGELGPSVTLMIPLCTLTPTGTQSMPAPTLTPGFQTFTTTPG